MYVYSSSYMYVYVVPFPNNCCQFCTKYVHTCTCTCMYTHYNEQVDDLPGMELLLLVASLPLQPLLADSSFLLPLLFLLYPPSTLQLRGVCQLGKDNNDTSTQFM